MSASSSLSFHPGTPAVWTCAQDRPIALTGLVERLVAESATLVWLDSARLHPLTGRFSILGWDPWRTFSSSDPSSLTSLRDVMRRYPGPQASPELPPAGFGWLGLFSYELSQRIERLPRPKSVDIQVPELLVFGMRQLIVVDHVDGVSWLVSVVDPDAPPATAQQDAQARLEAMIELADSADHVEHAGPTAGWLLPGSLTPSVAQSDFEEMVRRAQDYIKAGDIFQANLAQRFTAPWSGSPWQVYLTLRHVNPSPFACFISTPALSVVSCSPERLVQARGGVVQTRPIAGTRPRGTTPHEDAVNSLELLLSDKERAEHLMLVDLARNDLGRICRFGSVMADELMALEAYSHVIHIVSNVRGRLRSQVDAIDVLRAIFPGGTITGCPKVRAMEIIRELEPCARGFYTGSCGYLGFDGSMDLNILIRTIVTGASRLSFHVGAGIVADSVPEREYHETLAKAGALLKSLQATPMGFGNVAV